MPPISARMLMCPKAFDQRLLRTGSSTINSVAKTLRIISGRKRIASVELKPMLTGTGDLRIGRADGGPIGGALWARPQVDNLLCIGRAAGRPIGGALWARLQVDNLLHIRRADGGPIGGALWARPQVNNLLRIGRAAGGPIGGALWARPQVNSLPHNGRMPLHPE